MNNEEATKINTFKILPSFATQISYYSVQRSSMKSKYTARSKEEKKKSGDTAFSFQIHAVLAAVFNPDVAIWILHEYSLSLFGWYLVCMLMLLSLFFLYTAEVFYTYFAIFIAQSPRWHPRLCSAQLAQAVKKTQDGWATTKSFFPIFVLTMLLEGARDEPGLQ